jgi:hypothetical protein
MDALRETTITTRAKNVRRFHPTESRRSVTLFGLFDGKVSHLAYQAFRLRLPAKFSVTLRIMER